MVEKEQVSRLLKACLPPLEDEEVDRIANEVICDLEVIAHSIIRRVIAEQRERMYYRGLQAEAIENKFISVEKII